MIRAPSLSSYSWHDDGDGEQERARERKEWDGTWRYSQIVKSEDRKSRELLLGIAL